MSKYHVILLALLLLSCGKKKEVADSDVLMRFGDDQITLHEIVEMIPGGSSAADSAAMFDALLQAWVRDVVLADFAERRLYDTARIDRKVKDYRNSLIVLEYLSRMRETKPPKIDDQKVKEYYDRHRKELKLETPLIRGVFLKINSEDSHKDEIKKLLSSSDPDKIDILERDWLDRALQYNYFRDKWIDWETLKGMIPYRFGDPEQFLSEHTYFETDYEDCSYYLSISDWLPAGEEQPFEFARSWIIDLLTQGELADYERVLVNSLIEESLKNNKLEAIGYDPIKHEMIDKAID